MTDKTKLEHLVRAAQRGSRRRWRRWWAVSSRWCGRRRGAWPRRRTMPKTWPRRVTWPWCWPFARSARRGAPFAWYAKRRVYWAVQAAARRLKRGRSREEATLDEAGAGGLSPVDLLEDPAPGPEDCAIAASARAALRTAWDRLTPRQRQVLSARAGGATFLQVAAALGIAPSSAKGIAARGTARVKKLLAGRV